MDLTEELSPRVLLRKVLSTETPRTPITRSVAKRLSNTATRHSSRLSSKKDAGGQTPQDILRRNVKHKMRESITRKSLPDTSRRTASARKPNTPAATSALFDADDTPRHMLKNILLTEPVKSPLVHVNAAPEEPQPGSANSSISSRRPSVDLSKLELSDVTVGNLTSVVTGLSRKRPHRSLDVSTFEKRLKVGTEVGEESEVSLDDQSSLSLSSSTSLSLKTPYVDVQTERRGLQRNVGNRRRVTVEQFAAAASQWPLEYDDDQQAGPNQSSSFADNITLGLSESGEPDVTTDIVNCNTALYPHTDLITSVIGTQERKDLCQVEEEEEEGVEAQDAEEGAAEEEEGEMIPDSQTEGEDEALAEEEEEKEIPESQTEEEGAAEEEEEMIPDSQTEEEGAADEEEEEMIPESQTEEEGAAEEEEEEMIPDSQTEEEGAAEEEEEMIPGTQSEGEEEAVAEEEEKEMIPESQTEEEEDDAASEPEEEEMIPDGEDGVDAQSGEEEEEEEEEGEEAPESQTEQEESSQEDAPSLSLSVSQSDGDQAVPEDEEEEEEEASEQLEHMSGRAQRSEGGLIVPVGKEGELLPEATVEGGGPSAAEQSHSLQSHIEFPDAAEPSTRGEDESDSPVGAESDAGEGKSSPSRELSDDDNEEDDDDHMSDAEPVEEAAAPEEDVEWEDEEDDENEREMPAFVKEKIQFPDFKAPPTTTVLKNTQASSTSQTAPAAEAKRAPQRKRKPVKTSSGLPRSYVMNTFKHFAKTKVSADVYPILSQVMDKFIERMADDLQTYAAHAKRKTIEVEDAVLLLKRQGHVTDKVPVEVLIEKYLRLDQRQLLIPCATSGNVVIPKRRI